MSKKYIIEVSTKGTKKAAQEVKQVSEEVDTMNESAADSGEALGMMGGKLGMVASGFKAMAGGVKKVILGMKTLKGAMMATGIGLLVVAFGALVQYFKGTKRGADKLQRGMAWMQGVFGVITDKISAFGEVIVGAFENPKQAISDLWEALKTNIVNRFTGLIDQFKALGKVIEGVFSFDWGMVKEGASEAATAFVQVATGLDKEQQQSVADGFTEMGNAAADAANKSMELARIEQELADIIINQTVAQAERRKEIAKFRLVAEDETKTFEERIAALQQALDLENQNLAEKIANAKTEARLIEERNKLSESSREDEENLANAKAKVFELEEASLRQQKRIFTELQTLQLQKEAKAEAARKAEQKAADELAKGLEQTRKEILQATASKDELELLAVEDKYNKLLDKADQYGLDRAELEAARDRQIESINKAHNDRIVAQEKDAADKKKALDKGAADAKLRTANMAIGAISSLLDTVSKDNEGRARKAFNVNKALGIAQAGMNTAQAVTAALAETTPGRIVRAIATGVAGLAQVIKIKQTQFNSTGGGGNPLPSLPTAASAGAPTAPQIDFDFLNNPPQAYVLSGNVNSTLEAEQKLNDQATL